MNGTANFTRVLSCVLCVLLLAAAVWTFSGCQDQEKPGEPTIESATDLGEGQTRFYFTVTDKDGNVTSFSIRTDKKVVGEALLDEGLIEGEEGPYGLYVKKVLGISAVYEEDGTYWAFYENGQYAAAGVDMTDIVPETVYGFKVEK